MNKVTQKQYLDFRMWYYTTDKHMHLRLGQAFLSEFLRHIPDDELFYESDNQKAQEIIYAKYIDFEERANEQDVCQECGGGWLHKEGCSHEGDFWS